jgi:long-chain fatty acid transport protein
MKTICRDSYRKFAWLVFLLPAALHAQGIYGGSVSAQAIAKGGAVVASPDQPLDIMTENPAGLANTKSRNLDLGFMGVFAQGHFANVANTNGPISAFAGGAPYAAFAMPLGSSRFGLGLSVTPESSMTAKWRYVDAPGGAGGTSYGLQDNKSAILALRSAVGLGFAVTPKFSIGATLGVVYNSNTLQTPYVFQTQPVLKGLKTLVDLHTQGVGVNGSFGVSWRPISKLQFGMTYETRTVVHSHGDISGNASAQLQTLGLPVRSDFHYDAQVDNVFPQMVRAGLAWQFHPRFRVATQTDWINWNKAFVNLPLTLTNGDNSAINGLVGANSLKDFVPLRWRNQGIFRLGLEATLTERVSFRAGYSFASNPVPATTLTPLTAAIMRNALATGIGYHRSRYGLDVTYQYQLPTSEHVGQSILLAGEYNNSSVRIGLHSLVATASIHF